MSRNYTKAIPRYMGTLQNAGTADWRKLEKIFISRFYKCIG
jgi:hypothetical protein